MIQPKFLALSGILISTIIFFSCGPAESKKDSTPSEPETSESERVSENIHKLIDFALHHEGRINDSVSLGFPDLLDSLYATRNYKSLWTSERQWLPLADSLYDFIGGSKYYGLFASDYHYSSQSFIRRIFIADSLATNNAALWARADLLMTDAFFLLTKHLKQGRFPYDSVTLRSDSLLSDDFYTKTLNTAVESGAIRPVLHHLEPKWSGYDSLKAYLPGFLAKADFSPHTYLRYPYRDSVAFFRTLERRFHELGLIGPNAANLDTLAIAGVLRSYQKAQGYKVTGKLSELLVCSLNDTDWERFKRIAITMDRYKQLPDSLPKAFLWVNLPSYMMYVFNHDTLAFQSRVIIGGPQTRTPKLSSEISNFITYPQWTVPYSIIFKEMLPAIQQNVDYLEKQNLMVVDHNDSVLDPHLINWKKLTKEHFPYLIKQREGDDNSLGVIKFNFKNKYSVYMHDTNVRWLFGKSFRALSHGCVRIREWQKLANFLIRPDSVHYRPDSLKAWIQRQEKHTVSGFPKLPIYIRYFTCEGHGRKIVFYDDIYSEDKILSEKYFDKKSVD